MPAADMTWMALLSLRVAVDTAIAYEVSLWVRASADEGLQIMCRMVGVLVVTGILSTAMDLLNSGTHPNSALAWVAAILVTLIHGMLWYVLWRLRRIILSHLTSLARSHADDV